MVNRSTLLYNAFQAGARKCLHVMDEAISRPRLLETFPFVECEYCGTYPSGPLKCENCGAPRPRPEPKQECFEVYTVRPGMGAREFEKLVKRRGRPKPTSSRHILK